MTLVEKIKKDFITAFKNKENVKKNLLGRVKTQIVLLEKVQDVVLDSDVITLLTSELKKVKKTLEDDRIDKLSDLYVNSEKELKILEFYLPKQKTKEEVTTLIANYIKENNLTKSDFGRLMGFFSKELKGQFDNKILKDIISELLK